MMNGFEQAQAEYESNLFAPYDEGGACFDWDAYYDEQEAYAEMQAERMMDEIWSDI